MNFEPSPPGARPVLILPVGDFGWAAAKHLKRLLPQAAVLDGDVQGCLNTLLINTSATAVFTSWRPLPAVSDAIDARAYRTQTTSISLVLQEHEMVMGPVIIPGASSCWRCWDGRVFQADPQAKIKAQKRSFYADNPASGPHGYLPSLALLGAAQLAKALENANADENYAGLALRTDLFTRQITMEKAIGLDNCDRCGLQRPPSTRSYAGLQAALQRLWSQSSWELQ